MELNNQIEKYLGTKNISYVDFMNYFCDIFSNALKTNDDFFREKENLFEFVYNLFKKEFLEQSFKNIEINILTTLTYDPDFKSEDLKYLLTATQYPDKKQLEKYISQ